MPSVWGAEHNVLQLCVAVSIDTFAELPSDRDPIEERPGAHHSDARNRHLVKNGKTEVQALSVVMMKCGNRRPNDLRLGVAGTKVCLSS
jgi:hypothetical protein